MKYLYSYKIKRNKNLVVLEMNDKDIDDIGEMVLLDLEKLDKQDKIDLKNHILLIHYELEKIYKKGD